MSGGLRQRIHLFGALGTQGQQRGLFRGHAALQLLDLLQSAADGAYALGTGAVETVVIGELAPELGGILLVEDNLHLAFATHPVGGDDLLAQRFKLLLERGAGIAATLLQAGELGRLCALVGIEGFQRARSCRSPLRWRAARHADGNAGHAYPTGYRATVDLAPHILQPFLFALTAHRQRPERGAQQPQTQAAAFPASDRPAPVSGSIVEQLHQQPAVHLRRAFEPLR